MRCSGGALQDIPLDQRQTLLKEGPREGRLLLLASAVEGEDVQVLAEQ